ncbi:MAG TPA: 2-dehydropantoate 2-reductase [Anaerolineales bacterium]|nr:2-dehydropantoate 2-reductase [Anaerolineales bacterium]
MSPQFSATSSSAAERSPVLIAGTGAMACLFAAHFSQAGVEAIMLGTWPQGLQALQRCGVTLVDTAGREQTLPVRATDDPQACSGSRLALVLVKSWQTERAARQLAACLAPDGLALTLQNGLGNHEVLMRALGAERVAQGVTTIGANLLAPGRVRLAGEGVINLADHPRLKPLLELLRRPGFSVEITPNPESLVWGKLVINAAINPLTAILGVQNGELLELPGARRLMAAAGGEAAAVATALEISLPYPDPVAAAEAVARRTALNRSSMLQDISRGAPTEIDAICGAIVRAGKQTGVPTPVNETLWQLIQALVASKEPAAVQPAQKQSYAFQSYPFYQEQRKS